MAGYPDFLARLELDDGADERQVRRAYARELKRIDQERDLEGFQYLRTCYERALDWVADPDRGMDVLDVLAAPEAAPPPVPPRPEPVPVQRETPAPAPAPRAPSPHALSAAVFADFTAAAANLAALPDKASADDAPRVAPWAQALRAALADDRLLHLDARGAFEQRVAALLAAGWRPGHHLLLPAAVEVFGWGEDWRALQRLGHPGWTLDAALEQRAMFQALNIKVRTEQRAALALLRDPALPGVRAMRRHIRAVRALASRFPDLLGVVAPRATVVEWLERCPPTRREEAQAVAPYEEKQPWWRSWRVIAFVLFVLVRGLMILDRPDHPPPRGLDQDLYDRLHAPPAAAPGSQPVAQERLEQIRQRIAYQPGKHARPGEQTVKLQVVLSADGAVLGIDELESTGDPAFAAAVQRAIRASGPFPRETVRTFSVTYSVTLGGRLARAPQAPGMDLWKPAPAAPFQLPPAAAPPATLPADVPEAGLAPQADPGR